MSVVGAHTSCDIIDFVNSTLLFRLDLQTESCKVLGNWINPYLQIPIGYFITRRWDIWIVRRHTGCLNASREYSHGHASSRNERCKHYEKKVFRLPNLLISHRVFHRWHIVCESSCLIRREVRARVEMPHHIYITTHSLHAPDL